MVTIYASALMGINATTVCVEVNITTGIGTFIVGLPDNAVKESLFRINSAFETNKFKVPGRKIIVNLSPADLRKEGSAYDLPIAVATLIASAQLVCDDVESTMIMGELSLDGSLRPIKGALPIAIHARERGFKRLIVPKENASEAGVVNNIDVYGLESLTEVVEFLRGERQVETTHVDPRVQFAENVAEFDVDFSEVKGQEQVKWALEVAAAGGHNVIMIGSPGSGKTMIARRLPTIMPPMTLKEALETTKIHSVAGKMGHEGGLVCRRPFRSPHHMASQVAIVGGGSNPMPGEISLAHNGILFLDELPEFPRNVVEVMRQPLEDKVVTIARSKYTIDYPANFMLVAAMNPCPCGYFNHPTHECSCTQVMISRYMNRISGPMMDRIDMHIEVAPVAIGQMRDESEILDTSAEIRARVTAARERQIARFQEDGIHSNAMMTSRHIRKYCVLDAASSKMLAEAMERMNLSARAHDRIIKMARTVADIKGSENILPEHIAQAIGYRALDRTNWGVR